jgi:hypothetical protein
MTDLTVCLELEVKHSVKSLKFMHKRLAELEGSPMPYSDVEYEELKRRYAKVLDEGSCLNARLSKSEQFEKLKVLA